MCKVFTERDPLLRSEGPLTVFYWFVREFGEDSPARLAEFLNTFDRALTDTRRTMRNDPDVLVDPDLALYIALSRSINDHGSLERRFRILATKYEAFVQGGFPGNWAQWIADEADPGSL